MKRPLIHILVIASLLLTGCGRKHSTKDTAPGAFTRGAAPEGPAPKPATMLVVVDPGQPVSTAAPVAEVMLTGGHRLELRLVDAPVGQPMEVTFEARDARGDVLQKISTQAVPTGPGWTVYNQVPASYETNRAGRWTWTASIKGGRTYTTSVSVLPPTPAEMQRLARHEEARENVLRAFSSYWFASGEHLYTKLLQPTTQSGAPTAVFVQVRRWEPDLVLTEVSEVDLLNGVTYRGKASFNFQYFRVFGAEHGGWSEWSDSKDDLASYVASHTQASTSQLDAMVAGLGVKVAPKPRPPLAALLKLDYTLTQKDGNWFLDVAGDGEVVNGQRNSALPLHVVAPSPDEIKSLLTRGRVPVRENDKARGDLARQTAPPLGRPAIDTMTLVRGRTLR